MAILNRVFQILRIVVNDEDTVLEGVLEDFGKEERVEQVWGGDKLKVQERKSLCGAKGVPLYFILHIISNHLGGIPSDWWFTCMTYNF